MCRKCVETIKICKSLPYLEKWTACFDTLAVVRIELTDNFLGFHLYTEMFFDKINRRQNGQERIPFAAAGAANFTDFGQGFRGHLMG